MMDDIYDFIFEHVPLVPTLNVLTLFAEDTRTGIESPTVIVPVYRDNVDPIIWAPSPTQMTADTTPEISARVSDAGSGLGAAAEWSLPRKLFLDRDGLRVRLVVERWQL